MSAQTPTGSAARLRALDHTDSQATFRVLLDALSRPGTVHRLPEGVVDVDVPAGIDSGQRIRISGAGHAGEPG